MCVPVLQLLKGHIEIHDDMCTVYSCSRLEFNTSNEDNFSRICFTMGYAHNSNVASTIWAIYIVVRRCWDHGKGKWHTFSPSSINQRHTSTLPSGWSGMTLWVYIHVGSTTDACLKVGEVLVNGVVCSRHSTAILANPGSGHCTVPICRWTPLLPCLPTVGLIAPCFTTAIYKWHIVHRNRCVCVVEIFLPHLGHSLPIMFWQQLCTSALQHSIHIRFRLSRDVYVHWLAGEWRGCPQTAQGMLSQGSLQYGHTVTSHRQLRWKVWRQHGTRSFSSWFRNSPLQMKHHHYHHFYVLIAVWTVQAPHRYCERIHHKV